MSQTSPAANTGDAQKLTYHPPQVRELGQLSDVTMNSAGSIMSDGQFYQSLS